jgi:hypothetical protein
MSKPELTGDAKRMFALAFDGMGGLQKLTAWAKSHPRDFYCQIYSKLLPFTLTADVDVSVKEDDESVRDKFVEVLTRLAETRRHQAAEDAAANIFRYADGSVIQDPTRIAIEQQIHALRQQANALDEGIEAQPIEGTVHSYVTVATGIPAPVSPQPTQGGAAPAPREPINRAAPSPPRPDLKVVSEPTKPAPPQPLTATPQEPSNDAKWRAWDASNSSGRINPRDWGPV